MLFVSFFFISKIWWQVLRLMGFFWDRVALKRAELVNPYPCPCPCQLWSILDSLYQVLPSFIKSFWSSFFGSLQFLKSFWSSQRLSMWSSFQLLFVFVYFDSFEFLADFFQFLGLFESFNLFSTRRDRLNLFSVGSFGFFGETGDVSGTKSYGFEFFCCNQRLNCFLGARPSHLFIRNRFLLGCSGGETGFGESSSASFELWLAS